MQAGENEWTVLDADAQEKIEELGRTWSMEKAEEQLASGNPWNESGFRILLGFLRPLEEIRDIPAQLNIDEPDRPQIKIHPAPGKGGPCYGLFPGQPLP